jgi:hypothetical protein
MMRTRSVERSRGSSLATTIPTRWTSSPWKKTPFGQPALLFALSLRSIGSENETATIQSMGLTNGSGSMPFARRFLFSARALRRLASQ